MVGFGVALRLGVGAPVRRVVGVAEGPVVTNVRWRVGVGDGDAHCRSQRLER